MYREPIVRGRKLELKSTVWTRRKKETSNQKRMKKQEFKKNERLRDLQDIFKRSNIQIIGIPEAEEEDQKIDNLFEQIMKENFPHLAKEIDFQEVQEVQRVPKKLNQRRNTPSTSSLHYPRLKRRES